MDEVKTRVEHLLKHGYKTASGQVFRDSDKALLLAYWEQDGLYLNNEQKHVFMNYCGVSESITRARRALKADYPASKEVDDMRYDKFKDTRDNYSTKAVHVSFKD